MFVVNEDYKTGFKIGDIVENTCDLRNFKGTLKKGSKCRIIGFDQMRGYDVIDCESGEQVLECGYDFKPYTKKC